jgi:SnoaL-like domain
MSALLTSRKPSPKIRLVPILLLGGLLAACGRAPVPLPDLNASYERALARTAPLAVACEPGSERQQAAFDRLQAYFTNMSADSVREQTATVYAPQAYLNDTLVGLDGAARIQAYFSHTMQATRVLNVRFLDRAPSGIDCFVRWEMTVEHDALAGGKPVLSYGVTQFRFDQEGRVLLHKDFWDSGTGLFEQMPLLGGIIARVRAIAEQGAQ